VIEILRDFFSCQIHPSLRFFYAKSNKLAPHGLHFYCEGVFFRIMTEAVNDSIRLEAILKHESMSNILSHILFTIKMCIGDIATVESKNSVLSPLYSKF